MQTHLERVIQILFHPCLEKDNSRVTHYRQHPLFQVCNHGTSDYGAGSLYNKATNMAAFQKLVTVQKMEFLIEQYKET
jgi:hypothetical protein